MPISMQQSTMTKNKLFNINVTSTISAWLFLIASWTGLAYATKDFIGALLRPNPLEYSALLSSDLGFFGLLSFGSSSIAVLLAAKGKLNTHKKLFSLFKYTLIFSSIFLLPIFLAALSFLGFLMKQN